MSYRRSFLAYFLQETPERSAEDSLAVRRCQIELLKRRHLLQ